MVSERRRARRAQLAAVRLLGLFDRPADPGCLAALRAEPAIAGLTEPLSSTPGLTDFFRKPVPADDNRGTSRSIGSMSAGWSIRRRETPPSMPIRSYANTSRNNSARDNSSAARCPPAALRALKGQRAPLAGRSRRPPAALSGRGPRLPGRVLSGSVR